MKLRLEIGLGLWLQAVQGSRSKKAGLQGSGPLKKQDSGLCGKKFSELHALKQRSPSSKTIELQAHWLLPFPLWDPVRSSFQLEDRVSVLFNSFTHTMRSSFDFLHVTHVTVLEKFCYFGKAAANHKILMCSRGSSNFQAEGNWVPLSALRFTILSGNACHIFVSSFLH